MFALLGLEGCLGVLSDAVDEAGLRVLDPRGGLLEPLGFGFRRWLASRQDPITVSPFGIEFVDDPMLEAALLAQFIEENTPGDVLHPIDEQVVDRCISGRNPFRVTANLDLVAEARERLYDLDPARGVLVDLILTKVFSAHVPSSLGGSTARAIGVLWVDFPFETRVRDVMELVVHELTHHLLFVDDQVRGHYLPAAPHACAQSAIRRVERPVPCVFDSLVVAVELLALRRELARWFSAVDDGGLHPATSTMLDGAFDALASLEPVADVLSHRGRELLRACARRLVAMT